MQTGLSGDGGIARFVVFVTGSIGAVGVSVFRNPYGLGCVPVFVLAPVFTPIVIVPLNFHYGGDRGTGRTLDNDIWTRNFDDGRPVASAQCKRCEHCSQQY